MITTIVTPPATAAEEASVSAAAELSALEARMQPVYEELGACRSLAELEAIRQRTAEDLASLQHTAANLKTAQSRADAMADELAARLSDMDKALDRRWWKLNPPANAAIDLQERSRGGFAQGINGYKLALVTIIGSFAGVVLELVWCLVTNGYLESRAGLVWGPFNLLYGAGAALLTLCLYRYRNRGRWLSFLGGMIVGSAVEYGCSWLQETLFGSVSWDYSHLPFNLNGRICLLYSLMWGVLGVWWIKDVYPRLAKWILRIPPRPGKVLTWVMIIFLAVNALVSCAAVTRWSARTDGFPPRSAIDTLLDARFPDARMEQIYANMRFR